MEPGKTVKEIYYLDENELREMGRFAKTDYIAKSLKFYQSVKDKPVSQISPKQVDWLNKLRDMLLKREQYRQQRNQKYQPQKRFTLWPKKVHGEWVWLTYYE
jgi:hypothetical protein